MLPICPSCNETQVTDLGPLPNVRGIIVIGDPGRVFECPTCGMLFRHPYLNAEELEAAYAKIPEKIWTYNAHRADFDMGCSIINGSGSALDVLDVGCFRGDFLTRINPPCRLFGIEPSESAREVAVRHGVQLLGKTLDDAQVGSLAFDAITLFDVIEHLREPLKVLTKLKSWLKPGGMIIVSTGSTDVLPWRLSRNDYYYYYPEHVSFMCIRWFCWAAVRLRMDVQSVSRYSHTFKTVSETARQLARMGVYDVIRLTKKLPAIHALLRRIYPFSRACRWKNKPTLKPWPDHILVVLRAKS